MNDENRPKAAPENNGVPASGSVANGTARPRPVTLIGPKLYHLLIGNGYAITGVCRVCGAPLTDRKSVAAGVGPVCARRVSQNA